MNKIASLIILTLLYCLSANAAEINHNVQGRVADKITGDPIPAKVFLMDADSTILATTKATIENVPYQGQIALYVFNGKRLQKGKYIIKASMLGYKDAYENITLQSQRQTTLIANPILMEHDVHELQGVTVKATKIKMVMHGDTIVYNADAFNLAEGSMLDALVARLPGARLTREGQIFDKSLVMDVKLKKEYLATLFGNVEAGAGSDGRFALKGFGMKSSRKEMFFAFTNINNLSDNQKADMTGRWTPQDAPNGLLTNRSANVSYARFFDSSMDKWLSTQNTISHDDIDLQTRKNIETFLPGGNLVRLSQSQADTKTTVFDSQNALHYGESGKYSTMTSLNFHYKRNRKYADADAASSDSTSLLKHGQKRELSFDVVKQQYAEAYHRPAAFRFQHGV